MCGLSILAVVSTELSIKIANGVDAGGQGYRNLFAQTGTRTDKSYTNFQTKSTKAQRRSIYRDQLQPAHRCKLSDTRPFYSQEKTSHWAGS
jgi:hypothetical protein